MKITRITPTININKHTRRTQNHAKMKLKIAMSSVERLKNTLTPIVALRKYCVLRFTKDHLNVISAELNAPQVWCKLSVEIFDIYEVESLRDNTIALEMNVEQLFQVLRQYEKSNAEQLAIRLQKRDTNAGKRSASLGIFFSDTVDNTSRVDHTFNIPVRLLRRESDARITEPEIMKVDVMMKLPSETNLLMKRVERFKSAGLIQVSGSNLGKLSLNINDESNVNLSISWNELLEVTSQQSQSQSQSQEEEEEKNFDITVKMKDWKLGTRICEVCKAVVLIISHDEALVFHCSLDEDDTCEIIYFINAVTK